jgi:hypothetical protein
MKPLSRRHLLRGAAGVALGLPFLDAMVPRVNAIRSANAEPAKPPKRVVFLLTPDGFEVDRWKIPVTGLDTPLTPELVAKSTLSEFGKATNNILDKCLFIEGVPMSSALDPRNPVFTGGWAGPGTQYGGSPTNFSVGPPIYESVDQLIAAQMAKLTRFPAMYAGVHVSDNTLARRVFFAKGQTSITPEADPYKLLSTVFGELDPAALAQAKARAAERTFLMDAVRGDYKSLRCRLDGSDRVRLDQHLSQVEGLLGRLNLAAGGLACTKPNVAAGLVRTDFSKAPALTTSMMDLVAMAFACDLTRVVGFQLHAPDMDGDGIYSWLGHDMIYHQISHREGVAPEDKLQQADRWRAQQIMYLVSKLQAMKEPDGSSVFDNTTILWASEVGRGWSHDYKDVVWNIIGDGQGYFKTGRYMKFSGTTTSRHNLLLQHYLRYFGIDPATTLIGHPDHAKGAPLPGLATV